MGPPVHEDTFVGFFFKLKILLLQLTLLCDHAQIPTLLAEFNLALFF